MLYRCMIFLLSICVSSTAYAYCNLNSYKLRQGFEESVNEYIEYLICLHNKQVSSLNKHADAIKDLNRGETEVRSYINRNVTDLSSSIQDLMGLLSNIKTNQEWIIRRIDEIEIQLEALNQ